MTGKKRLLWLPMFMYAMALFSCGRKPLATPPALPNPDTTSSAEKIAPDIKSTALLDLHDQAPYVALDFPKMVKAPEATFLNEHEYVLGLTAGGESRAYPTRFMKFHHVVNDSIVTASGLATPIAITYCVICNAGIRYDPVINWKRLLFDFYGIYNGISTLFERQSHGVFLPAEGRIVTGPLTGTHLKTNPLLDTTWGQWKRLHPDTLVMSPNTPFKKFYGTAKDTIQRSRTDFPMDMFRSTLTRGDARLAQFDSVLAVTLPTDTSAHASLHRAYPLKALQHAGGIVNDMLGGKPVGVLWDTKTQTASALSRQLGTKTLTFEAHRRAGGEIAFYDHETGTRWNLEGTGEEGPLMGSQLERLDNHLSQWYGWAASFPDTSIYGRKDPPRPTKPVPEIGEP